jgi:hypothetical protein
MFHAQRTESTMIALENRLARFLCSEDGASAVSWVALTASALAILLAAMSLVSGGVENLAEDTRNTMANFHPEEGVAPGPAVQSSGDVALQ